MRLIDWRTIREEKIRRGRTWIKSRPDFPAPKVRGTGRGGDLWDEADVDVWLQAFVDKSQAEMTAQRVVTTPAKSKSKKRAAAQRLAA